MQHQRSVRELAAVGAPLGVRCILHHL